MSTVRAEFETGGKEAERHSAAEQRPLHVQPIAVARPAAAATVGMSGRTHSPTLGAGVRSSALSLSANKYCSLVI
jgi:hypothetical protein